jgi:hypothetical protein
MRPWKHLHYLATGVESELTALDCSATLLALVSGGRIVLAGGAHQESRDELAGLLDGTVLAELLASGRPIVADSVPGAYVFLEV